MIMALFRKRNNLIIPTSTEVRIGIEVDKNATKEAAEKAKKSTRYLNDLLEENGFHIEIYRNAGGKKK